VGDVVQANLRALTCPLPGAFLSVNIGTGIGTSIAELEGLLRQEVERLTGNAPLVAVEGPPRPGDLDRSVLDSARAGERLGWHPEVALTTGLRLTATWFYQQWRGGNPGPAHPGAQPPEVRGGLPA
jgi:UDP-glucose 4-epimerase